MPQDAPQTLHMADGSVVNDDVQDFAKPRCFGSVWIEEDANDNFQSLNSITSVAMSLELAFRRLSIRPSASVCRDCRRAFASAPPPTRPQTVTGGTAELLANVREHVPAQRQVPSASIETATKTSPPSQTPTSAQSRAHELAADMIRDTMASSQERISRERVAALQRDWSRADLERQQVRKWNVGDVYAPHDLSGTEAAKWKKLRRRGKPNYDIMDQLGINPIHHYKNFSIMSEYMTDMGRIKHRRETSLRPVNQRRMAKAIRRAIGLGLMPGVHRHPEILRLEMTHRQRFR